MTDQPPQRSRRRRVVLAGGARQVTVLRTINEVEQQTSIGEVLVRNLIRAQLRAAAWLAALVIVVLGSVPILAVSWPAFAHADISGVPIPWLVLGGAAFPLLFFVGYWYNRLAERNERDFVNMVEN